LINTDWKSDTKVSCTADLVSRLGKGRSAPVKVEIRFVLGFLHYCRDENLSGDLRHTVRTLLEAAVRSNCDDALLELLKIDVLKLQNNGIKNLAPMSSLQKLSWLDLRANDIADIAPLKGLANLEWLDLRYNADIIDLSPIANLPKLKWLHLDGTALAKGTVKKNEQNCPTKAGTNKEILKFCKE